MANSVRILASVKDEISSALDRMRDKFDLMGKGAASASLIGNVGATALTKGMGVLRDSIGKVVDVVGDSITAFREDEKSQAGLRAALLANIPAWDGNTKAIEDTIASRMALGFSDDVQRESLKILTAVTHDSTKALDGQRVAMDLARFRSIDLASASDLIAKVMGGNVGILRRYGISIKDGATATEALAEVTRLAGGQARAYAETDLGKVEAANIRIEESNERIGASFSKIETAVKPAMASASESVADFVVGGIAGWQMLGDAVGRFVADGGIIGHVFRDQTPVIVGATTEWKDALGSVIDPAGMSKIATAAEDAAEPIYTYFDTAAFKAEASVKEGMRDIAGEIRQGRGAIVSAMKQVISDTYDPLVLAAEISVAKLELADAKTAASAKKLTAIEKAEADLRVAQLERSLAEMLAEQTQYGSDSAVLAAQSGAFTTAQWRAGLTSQDDQIAADWASLLEIQTRAQLDAEAAARTGGSTIGLTYGDTVRQGIDAQAGAIYSAGAAAIGPLSTFNPNGYPIGSSWTQEIAQGITANDWRIDAAIKVIGSSMIGFSPPKAGPLKDIDKGARNIARAWTDAFAKGIGGGGIDNALSQIAGRLASGPAAASGGLSTAAGAVGGSPTIIQVQLDGRVVAEVTDRNLYYRTGHRGLLPA